MPKLSFSHLSPNNFEKMRVNYAFQLFSLDVEKGFNLYKDKIECQYGNSEATSKFIRIIRNVINVMTARIPSNSFLNSEKYNILLDFLKYLDDWKTVAATKDDKGYLSQSTASGLRVTVKSTVDLLEFLTEAAGFKYLMTSCLSQDTIENIFEIVRESSGCNDHPTPYEFLITVQCLNIYNLANPVKGGNCDQEKSIINSLVTCDDITPEASYIDKLCEIENSVADLIPQISESNILNQHTPEFEILRVFAGYVMRRCILKMNCEG